MQNCLNNCRMAIYVISGFLILKETVIMNTFLWLLDFVTLIRVHSLSSSKGEMFLCAACHAFTPHMNEWKN